MSASAFRPSSAPWFVEKSQYGFAVMGGNEKTSVLVAEHLSERAARLIAAAPELYEALEHIREMLVAYGPRYIEKATKVADAALAEARGETA